MLCWGSVPGYATNIPQGYFTDNGQSYDCHSVREVILKNHIASATTDTHNDKSVSRTHEELNTSKIKVTQTKLFTSDT